MVGVAGITFLPKAFSSSNPSKSRAAVNSDSNGRKRITKFGDLAEVVWYSLADNSLILLPKSLACLSSNTAFSA